MSLTNALNNAVSGLNVSQASLALVSQNIANANNENYSRKVAIQEAVIAGGARAGVRIAEIKRYVDQYLRREILSTSADWGQYDAQMPFLDRLQNTFGQPGSDTTLTSRLDRVFAAFETAGTMADNSAARAEVVFALESLTREVAQIDNEIQVLRRDIDTQISQEIDQLGIHFALVSPTFGFRGCDDRRLGPCRGPARAAPPAGTVGRKAGHEPANGGD